MAHIYSILFVRFDGRNLNDLRYSHYMRLHILDCHRDESWPNNKRLVLDANNEDLLAVSWTACQGRIGATYCRNGVGLGLSPLHLGFRAKGCNICAIFCTVCAKSSSVDVSKLVFSPGGGVIVSREMNFLSISLELPRALGPTSSGCLRCHHGVSWPTWGAPIDDLEGWDSWRVFNGFHRGFGRSCGASSATWIRRTWCFTTKEFLSCGSGAGTSETPVLSGWSCSLRLV